MDSESSSISTIALEQIVEKLKYESNRKSTDKTYYQVWKLFNQFFIKLDQKPVTWEDRLVLFVGYLVNTDKKSTTIRSYISAIKSVLYRDGIILNENKFLLNSLTKACRLKNDRIRTHLLIRKSLLCLLIDSRDLVYAQSPQPYLSTMYKALFMTAYYGLFRLREVTEGPHVIKAVDVHVGDNKNKVMFVLHTSKTHGHDKKPQIVKISEVSDGTNNDNKISMHGLCPFQLLRDYWDLRKMCNDRQHEQFFVFQDRSLVKPFHVRALLKKLIILNDLDGTLYCFHGIRMGCATNMLHLNFSLESIRQIGRWKSTAVYTYLRA